MRLLLVYDCIYPDSVGGVELRNHELARILVRRGHDVTLAGWVRSDVTPPSGVSLLSLGDPGPLYGSHGRRRTDLALKLAARARSLPLSDFDVVETANIPYAHLLSLDRRARRAGVPLVVTWYEYWGRYWREYVGYPLWPIYALIERATAGLGFRAAVMSELTRRRLQTRRPGEEIALLPGGVHVETIRRAVEQPLPCAPLVYAGRLLREKRVDLLLRAVARLESEAAAGMPTGPLLTVVGEGPDRERLEELGRQLGLGERVEFLGRLPEAREVWRVLGGARIAVQPSSREGFGLFPLEAMAAGLPVVHCESSESAVRELVRSGREGLETEATAAALAAALAALLTDEQRRRGYAEAAAKRAEELDWETAASKMERFLDETMAAFRAERRRGSGSG